jgi:hypothetical protein
VVSCIASDIAMEDEEDVAGCSASSESMDDYDTSSVVIGEGKSQLSFLFKLVTMNMTTSIHSSSTVHFHQQFAASGMMNLLFFY